MIPNISELHIPNMKKLTRGEQQYLRELLNGLDNQMLTVSEWLGTDEAKRFFRTRQADIDEFFKNSGIREELQTIINSNVDNSEDLIRKFYQVGSYLGYSDLHKKVVYTIADKEALYHVTQHNFELIRDLNTTLFEGIQETLFNAVAAGQGANETTRDILALGIKPLPIKNKKGEVVRLISSRTRARMIARTEHARAVNTGTLQAYSNYGVEQVEIITVGDSNVCDDCIELEENNPYSLEEAMNLLPVHPNCYDDKTEVFTNHGWKYFKDVSRDDKILSLNPDTLETEFLEYTQKIAHENTEGYMYHIYNKWFDTCVTPEHDCFVIQRKMVEGVRDNYPEFRKPYELTSESCFLRVAENNNVSPDTVDVNGLQFTAKDYAFFMAWYLSEGSILHNPKSAKHRSYPIKITQKKKYTRELLEKEFTRIADYLNIKLYIGKEYFEFHSKELHDYLEPLGYPYEKYIPKELFKLSREDLNMFLDMYILGDGHERETRPGKLNITNSSEKSIATSSVKLVDGLCYVILLAGFYPSIKLYSTAGTVVYCVSINKSKKARVDKCTIDKMEYTGMVYCLELPKYHTLWTRRNGKTSWNGNCRCSYGPVVEKPLWFPEDNPVVVDLTRMTTA